MDNLEGEIMSELENARLVRLPNKFGFINERPECDIILLLKLRNSVGSMERDWRPIHHRSFPWLCLPRVFSCLNKACYILYD